MHPFVRVRSSSVSNRSRLQHPGGFHKQPLQALDQIV